eukprot:jgi/Botrbrau1/6502/Bobra.0034s0075.1
MVLATSSSVLNASPWRAPALCFCFIRSSRTFVSATFRAEYFRFHGCRRHELSIKCSSTVGDDGTEDDDLKSNQDRIVSRRNIVFNSVNLAILGAAINADGTTIVNSILGAYGLPQLKAARGYRIYDDDPDYRFVFEYPTSWVGRTNTLRDGVYFSDFNTADKAVGEVYPLANSLPEGGLVEEVVLHFVSPKAQTGGDARLLMPNPRLIKSETSLVDGLEYMYLSFPSSTTTRSGYDIRRRNFGVAAVKNGTVYSLVASARSDQFNDNKEAQLRHIIDSFRVR